MKPEEANKLKEKKIQIFSKLRLINIFPGEWESIYRGDGIEFSDVRPFEPEDNPRDIDIQSLAESGEELVIERVETRQLIVYIFSDYSGSMQQFPQMLFPGKPLIRDMATALIIWGAVNIYSPVGFYPFGLAGKKFFAPRMGERYCLEILNWLAEEKNIRPYTSSGVEQALAALLKLAQPRNLVFFISDFKQKVFEADFSDLFKKAAGRFDFIPVVIRDPLEKEGALRSAVRIKVQSSSEKGKTEEIYFTPDTLRKMRDVSKNHLLHLEHNFKKLNIQPLILDSPLVDDCCRAFSGFFQNRKRSGR